MLYKNAGIRFRNTFTSQVAMSKINNLWDRVNNEIIK